MNFGFGNGFSQDSGRFGPAVFDIGGLIGVAGKIGSSILGANAADKASKEQAAALQQAIQTYQGMFQGVQTNEQPFIQGGQTAYNQLIGALPGLTQQFQPTMSQLEQTPGYQFALNQGLKATQNAFSAKGQAGGGSGPAIGGAATFAQGLASTTFQQQFQNYLAQNSQIANILQNATNPGLTAAGQLAGSAGQFGSLIGGAQTGVGNAQAAGTLGAAGQYQGLLTGAPTSYNTGITAFGGGQPGTGTGQFGNGTPAGQSTPSSLGSLSGLISNLFGGGNTSSNNQTTLSPANNNALIPQYAANSNAY